MPSQDSRSNDAGSDGSVGESAVVADHYASTTQRATAYLLDTAIVVAVVLALTRRWGTFRRIAAFFLGGAVSAGTYHVVLEGRGGQSLGKRVVGISVVGVDGNPFDYRSATLRTVARVVDFLPVGYLLGATGIRVTSKNQRVGDLAAGTVVVQTATGYEDENGSGNGSESCPDHAENQD